MSEATPSPAPTDPRLAQAFVFDGCRFDYASGEAELGYRFDSGPRMVERIRIPGAPFDPGRSGAVRVESALQLLHWIAGVSYYKAGVPARIECTGNEPDSATARFLEHLYLHGLGEFAWVNRLDLRERLRFPDGGPSPVLSDAVAGHAGTHRVLVPVGGGKDSCVTLETVRAAGWDATAVWVGSSELIESVVRVSGLPALNIERRIAPELFELNRIGAYNGHIPVTAINSAILVLAAVLHGFDAVVFSNEASASYGNARQGGLDINHQYSKSWDFEQRFAAVIAARLGDAPGYFSALRPWSELAVTRRFAQLTSYHPVFSSCNRNFRILGPRPDSRWCGQCPKCRFVFLALAPFMAKTRLCQIFGRNLLDEPDQLEGFLALAEWGAMKPFECVGEAGESRAAMAALAARAEWREDAVVLHFAQEVLPMIPGETLALEPLLAPAAPHAVPAALMDAWHAAG